MSNVIGRSGIKHGGVYSVVSEHGKIKATINTKEQEFMTWSAALAWIDEESKRTLVTYEIRRN